METRSHVLSTRVDAATRGRLYRAARERNAPISTLIRAAVTAIAERDYEAGAVLLGSDPSRAPEKTLAEIKALLGLVEDVSPAAIKLALDELLAALQPANEPTADNADVPPMPTALSARARKYVAARSSAPVTRTTTLSRDELDACKRLGITHAEFASRKRNAAKRVR